MGTWVAERKRSVVDVTRPPWRLISTRLQAPALRPDAVRRTELVRRLDGAREPIVSVAAPAGYGKTTLLAAWIESDGRASAWLSIGDDCNDPTVLLRYLAAALAPVASIDPAVFEELDGVHPRIDSVVVGGIGDAIRSVPEPILVVIDDLHLLTDRRGVACVGVLTTHAAPGSQIALVGRHETGFPLAKARAAGEVFELTVPDLRFDERSAGELLRNAGAANLSDDVVADLTEQTEGWAVGLYLAALSLASDPFADLAARPFNGGDRFVADYLREEVLSNLPGGDVDFLIHTSVLDEMWGSLCDATLGTTGSGAMLERLERSNLLVVPLDHHRGRYRYHHLLRDLLRMELERRSPQLIPELAGRASAWCEQHGMPDLAITYAIAGGEADRVAYLLLRFAQRAYYGGRAESVRRWIGWLDEHASIEDFPAVAVIGGLIMALSGKPAEAERWTEAAGRLDGSPEEPFYAVRAMLYAMMCRNGVDQMRADAERAIELLPPASEWRPSAKLFHGISLLLLGDPDAAREALIEAGTLGTEIGTAPAASAAFSELAAVALGEGDVDTAATWIDRGMKLVDEARLHGYASTAFTNAVAARVALLCGDQLRARGHMDEAMPLRGLLTSAIPTVALQARIQLAHCAMGLGDADRAELFLNEGADLVRSRPDLGALSDDLTSVGAELEQLRAVGGGLAALTPAEARLLPLLTTHLSFREIGEQLYVSPHTVKTQAIAIYRKFGVSSRGAAIEAARAIGLLAP